MAYVPVMTTVSTVKESSGDVGVYELELEPPPDGLAQAMKLSSRPATPPAYVNLSLNKPPSWSNWWYIALHTLLLSA